jgi:hypothetical protein
MPVFPFRSLRAGAVLVGAGLFFIACVWLTAGAEPAGQQKLFVLSLMLCTLGMLAFALARPATALVVGGGLFLALKFMSMLKLRYLDSALMPSDFIYFVGTSLVDTLRHYPHLYALGIGLCVGVPLLLWLVWRGDVHWWRGRRGWFALALRGSGVALCALAFWLCLLPQGVFAQIHQRNAWEKMSDDAQLTNFFINISDADVQLPAMSDADVAQQQWGATAPAAPGATHQP